LDGTHIVETLRRLEHRIGERFPDMRLPHQTGRVVDLHAERNGRPALIVVYRSARW